MPQRPAASREVPPLLRLGFRPFFLLAGFTAALFMLLWVYRLQGGTLPVTHPLRWHAHEMLFGFAGAVIVGFLLTAVRNWTGRDTPMGAGLAALVALWAAGRVLPFTPLPAGLTAVVDLAFLPVVAGVILRPILAVRQYQHLPVVGILLLLAAANLLVHLEALGWTAATAATGLRLAWLTVILLLVLMGGRVVPFFIGAATGRGEDLGPRRWLDLAGTITLVGWVLAMLAAPLATGTAWLALAAALFQALRLGSWHVPGLWRQPMLWVLYLGYGWIPLGLAYYGFTGLTGGAPLLTLHSFTAGAIGTLILGMMPRVSLGHTGRPIAASSLLVAAFLLVLAGGLMRVFGPALASSPLATAVVPWSGVVWATAFLLFAVAFTPVLSRPRVDGRPG